MTEIHITEEKKNSTAVLVGVETPEMRDGECDASLDELERLAETAGAVVAARLVQSREKPDVRTVIGSGKVAELKTICSECGAELCIFDCEMSPSQIRNVEDEVGEVRVIDRSMLILDIFALHAATAEGKLQVELAQLKYTTPRLTGRGLEMSRQGGGAIAARGPGETKLESDRRYIRRRIQVLEERLEEMAKNRQVQRAKRDGSGLFRFAVAGYTNAGKSTLMNYLTDAGILAQDKLFATLDLGAAITAAHKAAEERQRIAELKAAMEPEPMEEAEPEAETPEQVANWYARGGFVEAEASPVPPEEWQEQLPASMADNEAQPAPIPAPPAPPAPAPVPMAMVGDPWTIVVPCATREQMQGVAAALKAQGVVGTIMHGTVGQVYERMNGGY